MLDSDIINCPRWNKISFTCFLLSEFSAAEFNKVGICASGDTCTCVGAGADAGTCIGACAGIVCRVVPTTRRLILTGRYTFTGSKCVAFLVNVAASKKKRPQSEWMRAL